MYGEQVSVECSATKEISTSLLPQDSGTIEEEVAERSKEPELSRAGAKLSSGYAKIAVFMCKVKPISTLVWEKWTQRSKGQLMTFGE